jgi:hypothetical protein
MRAKSTVGLVIVAITLSGCSQIPVGNSPGSESNQQSQPSETLLTEAELDQLIRSLPEEKTRDGLRAHSRALEKAARQLEPFKIEYTAGPTAIPSKVESVVEMFSDKLKMYQLLGLDSLDQDWVIASEKDYAWWVDYRLSQDPGFDVSLWNTEINELGHCRLSAEVFCGAGSAFNGKNYQDNVVGTEFTELARLDYVSRHEAAHFYQAVFGYGGRCWMAEGQATFFETYLESTSRSRSDVLARLKASPTGIAQASEQEVLNLLTNDQICQGDSDIAYDLGMLGYEYLYLNFSFLDVHNLQVLSSTEGWDKAVIDVLGIDPQEINVALATYIYAESR